MSKVSYLIIGTITTFDGLNWCDELLLMKFVSDETHSIEQTLEEEKTPKKFPISTYTHDTIKRKLSHPRQQFKTL